MFIDVIRNQLAVTQLGARTIEGLPAGNIEIPRRTSGATAYFIAGDGDDSVTESTGLSILLISHQKQLVAFLNSQDLWRCKLYQKLNLYCVET